VIMKSVRLRGRLFAAVLHGFEAQVIQPEKAGRKIFGVRCKECLLQGAEKTRSVRNLLQDKLVLVVSAP
jgi:hypothetical protein